MLQQGRRNFASIIESTGTFAIKVLENLIYLSFTQGTLPWAIFRFRIFSNHFLQKFENIKITVWNSNNLTMCGNFCLDLY